MEINSGSDLDLEIFVNKLPPDDIKTIEGDLNVYII